MEPRVGDTVEVPGQMYGIVKFVGQVNGKKGTFAGVQLAPEFAARGKNSGEVEGKSYFRTTKPGSGIFLPLEKASKRPSPGTPATPSLGASTYGTRTPLAVLPKPNFSQSIGPGVRAGAASPAIKGRRPSIPRPQSPVRQTPAKIATPKTRPSVSLAKSTMGAGPQYRASPATKASKFSASLRSQSATTPMRRPPALLGPEAMFDEEPELTPTPTPAFLNKTTNHTAQTEEVDRLKASLEGKDRQLRDQALSLVDMGKSLAELQSLLPADGGALPTPPDDGTTNEIAELRAMLREKNEKIQCISTEFDAHRADFRSTIDTLEQASTETERVYETKLQELTDLEATHEQRTQELLQQVEDLQSQVQFLQEQRKDADAVDEQFRQMEELVQELEEGVEDSRRSEAAAKEELENLKGEAERTKAELEYEKEKAASAGRGFDDEEAQQDLYKELEQREDQIRGLKAMIQSLNNTSTNGHSNGYAHITNDEQYASMQRKVRELESLVERKAYREEELESELDRLRDAHHATSKDKHKSAGTVRSNRLSDRTVVPGGSKILDAIHARELETMHEGDAHSTVTDGSALWCEICETGGHDILSCTNMFGNEDERSHAHGSPESQRTGRDVVIEGLKGLQAPRRTQEAESPAALTPRKSMERPAQGDSGLKAPDPNDQGMVAGRGSGVIDEEKWCALCERDGHDSVDCPFEDAF